MDDLIQPQEYSPEMQEKMRQMSLRGINAQPAGMQPPQQSQESMGLIEFFRSLMGQPRPAQPEGELYTTGIRG